MSPRIAPKLEDLFDLLPQTFFEIDADGFVSFTNKSGYEQFQYTAADVENGLSAFDVFVPEERQRLRDKIGETLRGGKVNAAEFTALRKDGTQFPCMIWAGSVERDGAVAGIRGILVDIGERKRHETELRKFEEKYRLLVENANEMILVAQNGFLKYVNRKAEEITGYSEEELKSKPFLEFIHPDDRKFVLENYTKRMKGERIPDVYSFRILDRNGSVKWLQINAVRTMWENAPATLNFLSDITELKKAEESLQAQREQFFQAQKMEAIGRLTGGVAHDLNNILTVIIGYSELLANDSLGREHQLKYLREIKSAGEKASSFIKRLLAFSRKQVLQPRVVNLNRIILELQKMLARLIGEDVELLLHLEPELDNVEIDVNQFEQVMMNLAVNARDAMPHGGRITVRTGNRLLREELGFCGLTARPGAYVLVEIHDNGVGMSREVKEHLFEPFFTTKEKGRGTGLGLSTVYGIVRQSGGYISIDSESGAGTVVTLLFPRTTRPKSDPEAVRAADAPVVEGGETVLLVEDDDNVRNMISFILKSLNFAVREAKNGDQALAIVRRDPREPVDLVISDVIMPGMNGPVLAEKIRSCRPGVKMLFMSGYTDDTITQRGISEQGIPLIQKPFSVSDFGLKIRGVLDSVSR